MVGRPSQNLFVTFLILIVVLLLTPGLAAGMDEDRSVGRVEGRVWIGSAPMPEGQVILERNEPPPWRQERSSGKPRTAAVQDGRLFFENIEPGEWSVGIFKEIPVRNKQAYSPTWSPSHAVAFRLDEGETAHVRIGGTGRSVIGHLIPAKDEPSRIAYQGAAFRRVWLEAPRTACPDGLSNEERKAWQKKHYSSETGLHEWRARRSYVIDVKSDGSFRIEDVPAGNYTGQVEVSRWGEALDQDSGRAGLRFTVPAMPGGRSNEPLDLGEIEIQFDKPDRLKVGDPAPDFEITSIDGQKVKLSKLHGRHVLLAFWATWCEPCGKQVPYLRALWERFGENPRFAMIGLSFDSNTKQCRDYIHKHDLGWTQAMVEMGFKSDLAERYDVRGIPTILLIGPDGRIAAIKLFGKQIGKAVEGALITDR